MIISDYLNQNRLKVDRWIPCGITDDEDNANAAASSHVVHESIATV